MARTLYAGDTTAWQLVIKGIESAILASGKPVRIPDDDEPDGFRTVVAIPEASRGLRSVIAEIEKSIWPGCLCTCSLPQHPEIDRLARAYLTRIPAEPAAPLFQVVTF